MNIKQTILQMKYARIIKAFAEKADVSYEDAIGLFYASQTFRLLNEMVADLHCRSDLYLAEMLYDEVYAIS